MKTALIGVMMTPNELESLFKPLLGTGWQRKLSKLSLLAENTISNYRRGVRKITPDRELYFKLLYDWYLQTNNMTKQHGFALHHDILCKMVGGNLTGVTIENELRPVVPFKEHHP